MRTNPVKRKLLQGEPTFGTWISLGNLYAARVLSRLGFDWLTIDLEHAAINLEQAAALFAVIADAGCVPLARVPHGAHDEIKRVLDAGAWGIVVPMVESLAQAEAAIAAAKYPPAGNRSVGGGMSWLNFDATGEEYLTQADQEILVVLQIESPKGIALADDMFALPGCDAIFIGPNDLRCQMRQPDGTFPTAGEHAAAIQEVVDAGKRQKTPSGIHALSAEEARQRVEQGMQFLAIGSDLRFLALEADATLDAIKPDRPQRGLVSY